MHTSFAQAGTLRFQLLQEVPFCGTEAAGATFHSWAAGDAYFANYIALGLLRARCLPLSKSLCALTGTGNLVAERGPTSGAAGMRSDVERLPTGRLH